MRKRALAVVTLFVAFAAHARILMTQEQALASAFPNARPARQTFFLKPEQIVAAKKESGVDVPSALVIRYAAANGFAYFDTHRVRTLPETIMVVVAPDGRIERVEILSFDEPTDYFPKRRWLDQLLHRRLDHELSLNKAIRPISGASLTGRAIVDATRRVLALHHVLGTVLESK
ncbi:MAG TPA: FMN-binding protein [Thermoanaerobaculia bacterium]|nr:FMN-binding protein [Thermoanaerobaculia bacterium]